MSLGDILELLWCHWVSYWVFLRCHWVRYWDCSDVIGWVTGFCSDVIGWDTCFAQMSLGDILELLGCHWVSYWVLLRCHWVRYWDCSDVIGWVTGFCSDVIGWDTCFAQMSLGEILGLLGCHLVRYWFCLDVIGWDTEIALMHWVRYWVLFGSFGEILGFAQISLGETLGFAWLPLGEIFCSDVIGWDWVLPRCHLVRYWVMLRHWVRHWVLLWCEILGFRETWYSLVVSGWDSWLKRTLDILCHYKQNKSCRRPGSRGARHGFIWGI
jgi:hypothetical protein